MKKLLFLLLVCSVSLVNAQGSVSLQFENFVGNEPVVLKDKSYTNATGEQFNITLLYYYVSNLRLVRKDGSEYIVPQDESYFLIRENKPETKTITLNNIPKGTYTGVKFVIGIDSVRSASDISQRKGCLDVGGDGKDMYWAWNSGYIFVKMEGTSPQIDRKDPVFMYHIGLFGGIGDKKTLNNIRIADINFGEKALKIKSIGNAVIGIKTDVSKIMNGETNVSMVKNPVVMGGPYSAKITENYKTMFSFAGFKKELTAQPNTKVALGMN
jgi:hypothetical protein